jgi:glycosyltransferase involved in cell wall biosynthesis
MAEAGRGHVAMLVRNRYTHDSRVEKEASTLVEAGYRVTIVADAADGLPAREWRDGAEVIRVARTGPRIRGVRLVLHDLKLARLLRSLRPAVLHAHDSNALVPVAIAAGRLRVPFVYDAHDLWLGRPRRERSRLYHAIGGLYYRAVERLAIPRAAATLTVSPPIARHLERRYRIDRVDLVPNYPALDSPPAPRPLGELRGAEAVDPRRPIALYLGGLMAGRGLEELVDAVASVPDLQLVLLGDGVLEQPIRRRAVVRGLGDRVHVVPPVPPAEVLAVTASATFGVSPIVPSCLNYRYSLPNKLFQYMAAALPVVASDFPQVREIVDREGCGILVDTSRPAAIATAMRRLLGDPVAARAMGERGRAAVEGGLNWGTSAGTLLAVYDRVRR